MMRTLSQFAGLICWLPLAGMLLPCFAHGQLVEARVAPPAVQNSETVPPPQPLASDEQGDTLNLGELQGMALARHPAIAQGRARVDAARSNWVQVGLRPNPEIGYLGEEIGDEGEQGLQGGYISQRLVTADKLQLNRQVATQQIFAAEQQLAVDRQRVLNDVRIAYFDTLIAQRRLEVTADLVRIGNQNVEATQRAIRAMIGNRIDLLETEIAAERAEVERLTAESDWRACWRRLAAAVAVDELPPAKLGGDALADLPLLDWSTERSRLLHESPEIAAAVAEIDRTRWAWQRARAERYPDIDVGAAVLKNNATGDTVTSIELSLPLKLYDRNQGGISEAAAQHRAAVQALERLEYALQRRLADAFERYSSSRMQALRYHQQVLPRAKESLDLVQQAYAQGEINFLQVLTTERTFNEASLIYLTALERAWEANIEIEGLLLRDSHLDQ